MLQAYVVVDVSNTSEPRSADTVVDPPAVIGLDERSTVTDWSVTGIVVVGAMVEVDVVVEVLVLKVVGAVVSSVVVVLVDVVVLVEEAEEYVILKLVASPPVAHQSIAYGLFQFGSDTKLSMHRVSKVSRVLLYALKLVEVV